MTQQLTSVQDRLGALESKFGGIDDRMQSLETKLDQILSLLTALQPNSVTPAPQAENSGTNVAHP